MSEQARLPWFPVSFFSMIMGLSGYTLVWIKIDELGILGFSPVEIFAALSIALFIILSVLYVAKILKHRQSVIDELNHPAMLSFFPTITISLILIGTF
ncbi:MAG: C4-dicarboxylate ABC transporter, partial [Chromatiales bacterium]